jgi:hypothetical protein
MVRTGPRLRAHSNYVWLKTFILLCIEEVETLKRAFGLGWDAKENGALILLNSTLI